LKLKWRTSLKEQFEGEQQVHQGREYLDGISGLEELPSALLRSQEAFLMRNHVSVGDISAATRAIFGFSQQW